MNRYSCCATGGRCWRTPSVRLPSNRCSAWKATREFSSAIETCAAGSGCTCSFLECHPERRAQTESQQAPGLCLLGCWSEESRDPYFPSNPNLVAATGGQAVISCSYRGPSTPSFRMTGEQPPFESRYKV